jgi:hypothetical protein
MSKKDDDDYPLTHTAFGSRENNSSFIKAPLPMVNSANNWFEMYNQDQTKHIKIKKRRRVKKVKKDDLPDTVEGIYMREAVMALIHS